MKRNYLLIPLAVFATAFVGSLFTSATSTWYAALSKPSWTPPGAVIGAVWTVLFLLLAIAGLVAWNGANGARRRAIFFVFAANLFLNVLWSFIFFSAHLIGPAVFEAGVLGFSVLVLVILLWPVSRIASFLLVPYLLWVSFATYLTAVIWSLNR